MARHNLWPTPTRNANADCPSERLRHSPALASAVQMWPTPNVPNGGRTTWHAEQEGNSFYHNGTKVQLGLEQAVRMNPGPASTPIVKSMPCVLTPTNAPTPTTAGLFDTPAPPPMWPTPTSNDTKNAPYQRSNGKKYPTLPGAVLATPTSRDWKSGKASEETHDQNSRPLSEQVGGQLNPTWVGWLMGWPLDWEALGPLSPQTFRVWLQVSLTVLPACVPLGTVGSPNVPWPHGTYSLPTSEEGAAHAQ